VDVREYKRYSGMRACAKRGAIAQLGEHLLCKQGVVGSIPTGSKERKCTQDSFFVEGKKLCSVL
jgi:hypothetical protein